MIDTQQQESTSEFGKFLVGQGLISDAQLASVTARQRMSGGTFEQAFMDLEMLGAEQLTHARAKFLDIPYICLAEVTIDKSVLPMVDALVAQKYQVLPIGRKPDGTLRLAVGSWNAEIMEVASKIGVTNRTRIAPALVTEETLRKYIELSYTARVPVGAVAGELNMKNNPQGGPDPARPQLAPAPSRSAVPALLPPSAAATTPNRWGAQAAQSPALRASDVFTGASPAPANAARSSTNQPDAIEESGVDQPIVIQFVNRILADAIKRGASDIHFEPRRDKLDIRYRVDGTLHQVDSIRREFQAACTSRVKIMSDMNIAERRVPQDGRIAVTIDGRSVDMRVSSLPTQYGESVVLRILDKGGTRPSLEQLGFSDSNLKLMHNLIRKPHGIFLATGPTGSGKTTTLYSAIQAIHTPEVNIITVEDPIEYDLDGIRQSNVHEKAGLTFAKQLKAILRQDPDVIYVGEIRDAETAEIAFRAALTGHLVFSTLHCNDSSGAITRLLNMDMDPFLVSSSVVGILAQRLVRKVCSNCARPFKPDAYELKSFGLDPNSPEVRNANFQKGIGCDACDQTGYRGRCSVQELLALDDNIRNVILQRGSSTKIRSMAIADGMLTMRDDAAFKVMQGITTFEESAKRVYIEENAYEAAMS